MKIIIVGAGEVGFHIAQKLALESKEVVIIDNRAEALKRFSELLDVQTIQGSGSSPYVLEQAGVQHADTFLAVTDKDETNLVACLFADALSPGIVKLARIRDEHYTTYHAELTRKILNLSMIINPETEVVKSITRSMNVPGAEDFSEFAGGRIKLIGIRVNENAAVTGTRLMELRANVGALRFIVAAVFRNDRLIIPSGKDRIKAGDLVYFVCEAEDTEKVLELFGSRMESLRDILIVGGGNIGLRLARHLEEKPFHVRLIEKNLERCEFLVEQLQRTIVLHGDGTDQTLLEEENIQGMDVVISLTGDEETNVLTSLLAKRLGAKRCITRLSKFAYIPIAGAIGLGHIVSPRLSAINTILQHVRRGKVISAVSLKEEAEVLEAIALESSGIVGKPLKNLHFPKGAIVLAILRGDQSMIPTGDTVVLPQDNVIILSTRKNIPRVERELMVKLEYF
ncbi:MAG: Trk system potassium transporter TrkA [Deltaproteobacteria bacterium]|nr:Trk system potassium transporter TrkA [Deltaproteobacteria bacterium]